MRERLVERLVFAGAWEKSLRNIRCAAACTDPTTRGQPCPSLARYRIAGTPMCRRHAGGAVLDLLAVDDERTA
jgi:hypothetical protein